MYISSSPGINKTNIKNYLNGDSYFKHYFEIEDDEGKPIKVNDKFRQNHYNMDMSIGNVNKIKNKVMYHCRTAQRNQKIYKKFNDLKKMTRINHLVQCHIRMTGVYNERL
ncbi:MAG: hypothetical protein ACI4TX_03575 [Christensenellales bacterium]